VGSTTPWAPSLAALAKFRPNLSARMARASSSSGSSPHRADANISPAAASLISSLHSLDSAERTKVAIFPCESGGTEETGNRNEKPRGNDYGETLHILGFLQLRGPLDEDFAVELDDVQRLQHVVLLDHLLRLLDDNTHHSVSLLQTGKRRDTGTRDTSRQTDVHLRGRARGRGDR